MTSIVIVVSNLCQEPEEAIIHFLTRWLVQIVVLEEFPD
jgi:hypothetical protein